MSIEVHNVSKFYNGQKALDSVSFQINKGEIVGFLGPNGAGKSTLMRILTTYLPANEGSARVNGYDIEKDAFKVQKSVGYLPEHNPLYLEMYVREYLRFNASIYKTPKTRIEEVINQTGLNPEAHKKIGALSKGYRQRVGLANALLHDPVVLILDEPTTGLDPNQLSEIRGLIKEVGKEKTIFLSTHIMQEVEAICDRGIIINKGKIVADQKIAAFQGGASQIVEVEFDHHAEESALARLPHVRKVKSTGISTYEIQFNTTLDMRSHVFDFANEKGLKILHLNQKTKNLESLFRELTSNSEK